MLTFKREEYPCQRSEEEIRPLSRDRTGYYGKFPHKHRWVSQPTHEGTSIRHPHLQWTGKQTQTCEGSHAGRHRVRRREALGLKNRGNACPNPTEEAHSISFLTQRRVIDTAKEDFQQAEKGVPALSNLCWLTLSTKPSVILFDCN